MSVCVLSMSLVACNNAERDKGVGDKPKVEDQDSDDNKSDDDKTVEDNKTQNSSSSTNGSVADLEDNTNIVDVKKGIDYKEGEYPEVDFAVQLLKDYLAGKNIDDRIVSDNDDYTELIPITAEDKSDLDKRLKSTRIQIEVEDGKIINVEPLEIVKNNTADDDVLCYLIFNLMLTAEGSEDSYSDAYGVSVYKINGEYKGKIH